MANILISGSIAYDYIMSFEGTYKETILPESIDHLSVSYLAHDRKRFFGGCAGNIAYSLKLLGENPFIVSAAGSDFEEYRKWLEKHKILTKFIDVSEYDMTAAAYILNDKSHNQIAIFSPGVMLNDDLAMSFEKVKHFDVEVAIIAPDVPFRMVQLASECVKYGIPFIFDPGQAMSALSRDDLMEMVQNSMGIILNEYETKLLQERLGIDLDEIIRNEKFVVQTLGKKGAQIFQGTESELIPTKSLEEVSDVTGCGDAFRSGFLYGFVNGKSLSQSCKIGNKVAALALMKEGTQNHEISEEIMSSLK